MSGNDTHEEHAPPGATDHDAIDPMVPEARGPAPSRRRFMTGVAGATGLAVASSVLLAEPASAATGGGPAQHRGASSGAEPRPIPFLFHPPGLPPVHAFPPKPGFEHVDITDFDGYLGLASVEGTGTGTDTGTGKRTKLYFSADLRFFAGDYIGLDHRRHRATFSAI